MRITNLAVKKFWNRGFFFFLFGLSLFFQFHCNSEKSESQKSSLEKRAESLLEVVQSHPDGFTVDSNTFKTISSGYAVAPFDFVQIIEKRDKISIAQLKTLLSNIDRIKEFSNQEVYAGGWLNTANEQYHLDASVTVEDLDKALYLGLAGNQQIIYDFSVQQTIEIKAGIEKLKAEGLYSLGKEQLARAIVLKVKQEYFKN